jgi:hypothetical protein
MHATNLLSEWDTLVIMIPFLGLMALGMFRLDERFASPKASVPRRQKFCGVDGDGAPLLSDPDGRPWRRPLDGKRLSKRG